MQHFSAEGMHGSALRHTAACGSPANCWPQVPLTEGLCSLHPCAPQEKGNANAQSWNAAIQTALGDGWQRLGLRQLSGMLVLVYIRCDLMVRVLAISCHQVGC